LKEAIYSLLINIDFTTTFIFRSDDVFKRYTFSDKVRDLVRSLGYKDPVLPQSMYIFKQPEIGGAVTAHQDSTFLYTEPRLTCLGLWLALDDADESNGCLWYRPGSQKEPLRRRLVRDPGGFPPTKFVHLEEDKKYDGTVPVDLHKAGFIPVPVKAGDLVIIHGSVDHLSLPNTSHKPRHSFQLHLVEGPGNGVNWSKENWLQYHDGCEFARLSKTY
jgi:phytanoyl-CoA hydroxylase